MNADQYVPLARKTLKLLPYKQHMIHMGMGAVGETGEIIDAAKKVFIYLKDPTTIPAGATEPWFMTNMIEEIGDCFWYVGNTLPELGVEPWHLQRAIDQGVEEGTRAQPELLKDMMMGAYIINCSEAISRLYGGLIHEEQPQPGSGKAISYVESLGRCMGMMAGALGVDPHVAMERNIAKLKARYGEKFSEKAALNRDLSAERVALEGGTKGSGDSVTGDGMDVAGVRA